MRPFCTRIHVPGFIPPGTRNTAGLNDGNALRWQSLAGDGSRGALGTSLRQTSHAFQVSRLRSTAVRHSVHRCFSSCNEHKTSRPASISCSTIEVSPGHNCATIVLSNAAKMNIVDSELLTQLQQTCRDLSRDPDLRSVVLTGGPPAPDKSPSFIGGADITEMIKLSSSAEAKDFITAVHDTCVALRDLPVPVIARIHGFCLGAGLEIAASCDLRIATASSLFGMPEVKVGIPSVVEAALLPTLIGMGRTRRLLYLAENITATEAERWGLVECVVASEQFLDEMVLDWTARLARMGPRAIRNQKALIRQWENCNVERAIAAGVEAYAKAFDDGGEEPKEFMERFIVRKR